MCGVSFTHGIKICPGDFPLRGRIQCSGGLPPQQNKIIRRVFQLYVRKGTSKIVEIIPRTGRKGALHRKETVRHAGTNEFAKPGF
jgi:hypothetical protein